MEKYLLNNILLFLSALRYTLPSSS